MIVTLGASGAPSGFCGFRHLADEIFRNRADAVRLGKAGSGWSKDINRHRAFIELRQEFLAEEWHHRQHCKCHDSNRCQHGFTVREGKIQDTDLDAFDFA